MGVNFGKFVHTETGRRLMSMLLGFGLASLFRTVCKAKLFDFSRTTFRPI